MPELSGFLRRFRFHPVPGAPAAVPADRAAAVENELSAVFSLLATTEREVDATVAEAAREAAAVRSRAAAAAARLVAEARTRADSERRRAAARRLASAETERRNLLAAAEAEAARIDAVVAARLPALTRELVRRVLETEVSRP